MVFLEHWHKEALLKRYSFDAQNGPKAAVFIKDAVLKWPQLQPLRLILKVFLQQRELNEVYSGGIGSYALLSMLMAMLQVNFFDFYGCKLNTMDVGVSCKGAGTFCSRSDKGFLNKGQPFLISIEDPQAKLQILICYIMIRGLEESSGSSRHIHSDQPKSYCSHAHEGVT